MTTCRFVPTRDTWERHHECMNCAAQLIFRWADMTRVGHEWNIICPACGNYEPIDPRSLPLAIRTQV